MRTQKSEKQSYIESLTPESQQKIKARESSQTLNKEGISLSAVEGSILRTMLTVIAAQKVVEIGTLTGLSALYMLEGLSADGQIWTLEKDPAHFELAQKVFSENKTSKKIHSLLGDAREVLPTLSQQGPFCAVFIDANKAAYLDYLDWAESLVRPGGMIIADNVFLGGTVFENQSQEGGFSNKQVQVMREFNKRLMLSDQWISTIMPTDEGLLVAVKKS